MKLHLFVYLSIVFLFLSCDKKPDYVLDDDLMVKIMADLHYAEAISWSVGVQFQQFKDEYLYDAVFKHYNITQAQLDSSLNYYGSHPQLLDNIYVRVQEKLAEDEARVKSGFYSKNASDSVAFKLYVDSFDVAEKDSIISEIWTLQRDFNLPDYGEKSELNFRFPKTSFSGTFLVLKFDAVLLPGDCSENPYAEFGIEYKNKNTKITIPLKQDGEVHSYRMRLKIDPGYVPLFIFGKLAGYDKCLEIHKADLLNVRLYEMKFPEMKTNNVISEKILR